MKNVIFFGKSLPGVLVSVSLLSVSCNQQTTEVAGVSNQNRTVQTNSANSQPVPSLTPVSAPISSPPPVSGNALTVKGAAVIFLAGRDDIKIITPEQEVPDGYPLGRCSGGENAMTAPNLIKIADKKNFAFKASGEVDYYGGGDRKTAADGYPDQPSAIEPLGGISGYEGAGGALVGVFLDDKNPKETKAPATLDFSDAGQKTSFQKLMPEIGQIFFIGDGSIGLKSTEQQVFVAPLGATRLFLGTADASGFNGVPGCYEDNKGAFQVEVTAN